MLMHHHVFLSLALYTGVGGANVIIWTPSPKMLRATFEVKGEEEHGDEHGARGRGWRDRGNVQTPGEWGFSY